MTGDRSGAGRHVWVVNCGSSSLKFAVFGLDGAQVLATGLVERIGAEGGRLRATWPGDRRTDEVACFSDHAEALRGVFTRLRDAGLAAPDVIGHRVVHGGERFTGPTRIDAEVFLDLQRTIPLAPLHNPINLAGIATARAQFPDTPQVAVFDTAFHQTLPESAWRYALPRDWHHRWGVRRYGFHGTSHGYVARRAARWLGRAPEDCNLISLHLGNGASAAAIEAGRSVETSMGFTPLEGLVMGTRCGDMDPAIPAYMERVAGLSPEQVDADLNHESGLKALCGDYDMRAILARSAAGDADARLALDIYVHRIRKYLGAYLAVLGRVDAVLFTGGIGEHAAPVRAAICAGLEGLGLRLDPVANAGVSTPEVAIHAADSPVALLVIATDEEREIARQAVACLDA
ncbi:MAG: acetate/propionate family kinase [Pseudomonadota bacterium]